jgi:hypothetical protein
LASLPEETIDAEHISASKVEKHQKENFISNFKLEFENLWSRCCMLELVEHVIKITCVA